MFENVLRKRILECICIFLFIVFVPLGTRGGGLHASEHGFLYQIDWVRDIFQNIFDQSTINSFRYSYWHPLKLIERALISIISIGIYWWIENIMDKSDW